MKKNKEELITQARLKELLEYNKDTGLFYWKVKKQGIKQNNVAGHLSNSSGYIELRVDYKLYKAHRLVWLYVFGEFPKNEIDHLNHIRHDNRIDNLRDVSASVNSRNRSIGINNQSGFAGVHLDKQTNKWRAQIRFDNKLISLGRFPELKDAIEARKNANTFYGYHKNHGAIKGI